MDKRSWDGGRRPKVRPFEKDHRGFAPSVLTDDTGISRKCTQLSERQIHGCEETGYRLY